MALGSRKFIYCENLNCIACKNGSICEWKRAKTQNFSRFEFPEKFQIDVVFSISSFDYRKFALVLWGTFHLLFQKFDFSYFSPSATFLKHPNVWSLRSMLACINDRFAFTHFSIQFHSCWTLIISFFSFENGEVFVDLDFFFAFNRHRLAVAKSRWKCFDNSMCFVFYKTVVWVCVVLALVLLHFCSGIIGQNEIMLIAPSGNNCLTRKCWNFIEPSTGRSISFVMLFFFCMSR